MIIVGCWMLDVGVLIVGVLIVGCWMLDAGCVQVSLAPMTVAMAMAMAIYSAITRCDKIC